MALRLLAEDSKGGVLLFNSSIPLGINFSGDRLFCSVRDILIEKHPHGRMLPHVLLGCTIHLMGDVIKRATTHTHGAAGPSGVDAYVKLCVVADMYFLW